MTSKGSRSSGSSGTRSLPPQPSLYLFLSQDPLLLSVWIFTVLPLHAEGSSRRKTDTLVTDTPCTEGPSLLDRGTVFKEGASHPNKYLLTSVWASRNWPAGRSRPAEGPQGGGAGGSLGRAEREAQRRCPECRGEGRGLGAPGLTSQAPS